MRNRKEYWESVYQARASDQMSWYQLMPTTSLNLLAGLGIMSDAKIIDVGGGDSCLADYLLSEGYQDITVLDISETALERAQQRMGANANKIKWVNADITSFQPIEKYDLWHDRATFHFLTQPWEVENYLGTLQQSLVPSGAVIIGTFSEQGPEKCSGLNIRQYSESSLTHLFSRFFERINCITVDHETPAGVHQAFTFCSFKNRPTIKAQSDREVLVS